MCRVVVDPSATCISAALYTSNTTNREDVIGIFQSSTHLQDDRHTRLPGPARTIWPVR